MLAHFFISESYPGQLALNTMSQKQRIFPRNISECIWEQVHWPVNFRRRFNPSPFGNFRKYLTLLPSEISEKSRGKTKIILGEFDPLTSWSELGCLNHYTIAPYIIGIIFSQFNIKSYSSEISPLGALQWRGGTAVSPVSWVNFPTIRRKSWEGNFPIS